MAWEFEATHIPRYTHPLKTSITLENPPFFKRRYIFKCCFFFFQCHVGFEGCISQHDTILLVSFEASLWFFQTWNSLHETVMWNQRFKRPCRVTIFCKNCTHIGVAEESEKTSSPPTHQGSYIMNLSNMMFFRAISWRDICHLQLAGGFLCRTTSK